MRALLRRAAVVVFAIASMAHVGSPDTFFAGDAGPYHVRVSVRLPGVIPGRAQIVVRLVDPPRGAFKVSVRAGQWNLGLKGAPPPDEAKPVAGDPSLFSTEMWFMTATSYQLFVTVDGPSGQGTALVPVVALATSERSMDPSLGRLLAGLAVFLTLGMLTIVGCAVREAVLPPGLDPDGVRVSRARYAVAGTAVALGLALWGGSRWWAAEASSYGRLVLYRPFHTAASISPSSGGPLLTISIRDPRWITPPLPNSRYNGLIPDHGKLMHLFAIRTPSMDAFAHLHPVPRTPAANDFDVPLPPLPPGTYRLFADIVHESGYAQTLVATIDNAGESGAYQRADPDDSILTVTSGAPASMIHWDRGNRPFVAGEERLLAFSARDASGKVIDVEPYMGMAAHVAVANSDGSVFAHLHPSGSISMAALDHFSAGSPHGEHAGHAMALSGSVSIPYAFPKPGRYRVWVQMKIGGTVRTAPFDVAVTSGP